MIEPGSVIGGRYRLDHALGQGGMGAVWAATHTLTHKRVAIKLLKADVASPDTLRRFVREARAASAVRHPNVVEVHDILSLDDGSPAMVMDFLEGETLGQRLKRAGTIGLEELAAIMAPVVSAVGSAHAAGIVHRDLKPDNIFLAQLGDGRIEPMVLDFGIAKMLPFGEKTGSESALTQSGAMLGTPYYMAPEQAFGEADVDARVDVWALGVILYECSSGRKPIAGDTLGQVFKMITTGTTPPLSAVAPHLPEQFIALVEGMMERDREKRLRDLRQPFELLRTWSGSSVRGFGAAISSPPPAGSSSSDVTESLLGESGAASVPATVASARRGPDTSAVPVTRGVAGSRRGALLSLAIGVTVLGLVGVTVLGAAMFRRPAPSVESVAAGAPAAMPPISAPAPAAPAEPAPTLSPIPSTSASAAASASPRPTRPPKLAATPTTATVKSSAAPEPRKLLPGGVDDGIPF